VNGGGKGRKERVWGFDAKAWRYLSNGGNGRHG